MTSRLKRRLGDLGIDPASTKANESFCLIGTPLPPLEKSKDLGEFVPLWKQEVRDEKGRRRLHGAFTGGFSAGYFNTVGSKEGWTPSTFVSSRNDRAKKRAARPEDFMDEEDLQEIKDSRKFVDTADEMDLTGGTQAELQGRQADEPDSVASALEAAMLPAPKDSAGARILKKMGWRVGQGIGPRVTLRQRRLQDTQAASGYTKHMELSDIPEDDEEAKKHKYAPRDTPVLLVERKDNFHGLGYRPGMGLNESLGVKGESTLTGPKLSAGFGLGALNDADEDDLDVYDSGFGSKSGNKTAYDIGNEEDDRIHIGSNSRTPQVKSKATSGGTFDDGTPILAGFVLSDKPVVEDRWFPLPDVPKDWTPNPKRVWNSSDKENLENKAPSSQPAARMTADQRGEALGETPLPSAPRSVFDYISQKDRERIKNIASGLSSHPPPLSSHPPPLSSHPPPLSSHPPPPATPTIAHTDPRIASAALKGFQPFTSEPEKQARYTAYLQSQANPDSGAEALLNPLPGQRIDEFNKELEDYAKAALLFKPMSGAMAGRFTSAGIVEHAPSAQEGLRQPLPEKPAPVEEAKEPEEEELSPKAHAAKMGMFGPLTREITPWLPDRLLCKRFGVKEPELMPTNTDDVPKGFGTSLMAVTGSGPDAGPSSSSSATVPASEQQSSSRQGPRDLNNIGLGEDETQGRDTLTYERPTMDVFKAIFASDDEDSDVGEDPPEDKMDEDAPPQSSVVAPELKPPDTTTTATTNAVVDLSTFRPTFIRREGKAPDSDEKEKEKEKKKKKKRDKEKKGTLVSFAMDEEGGESLEIKEPRKKKDRRKEKRRKEDEDDDAMWVEKPPPELVNDVEMKAVAPVVNDDDQQQGVAAGPARGRKRAIDFM